jgi:hypothetical protein
VFFLLRRTHDLLSINPPVTRYRLIGLMLISGLAQGSVGLTEKVLPAAGPWWSAPAFLARVSGNFSRFPRSGIAIAVSMEMALGAKKFPVGKDSPEN